MLQVLLLLMFNPPIFHMGELAINIENAQKALGLFHMH